jgi:hypothetical protein
MAAGTERIKTAPAAGASTHTLTDAQHDQHVGAANLSGSLEL